MEEEEEEEAEEEKQKKKADISGRKSRQRGTADAEIKVPCTQNSKLSNIVSLKCA